MKTRRRIKHCIETLLGIKVFKKLPHGIDFIHDLEKTGVVPASIFDVGANTGQSAILFARRWPSSRIFSFEPVTETFQELTANTQRFANVTAIKNGVGEFDHEQALINVGSSSLKNSILACNSSGKREVIKLRNLDGFCSEQGILQVDLLKIDTEGYDLNVLKGGKRLLRDRKISAIFVEIGFDLNSDRHLRLSEFEDYLRSYDFSLHGIYDQTIRKKTGRLWFANALFIKDTA